MRYAYLRVSTDYQDYQAQRHSISSRYQIDKYYEDQGTGAITQPKLSELMKVATAGDEVIVTSFDRLGRKMQNVLHVIEQMKCNRVEIISIREGINITSPAGNMIMQMICSMAEYERSIISDRVKGGLAAAKQRGAEFGAPKKFGERRDEFIYYVHRLKDAGYSNLKIAGALGIGTGTVCTFTHESFKHEYDLGEEYQSLVDRIESGAWQEKPEQKTKEKPVRNRYKSIGSLARTYN